MSKIVEPHYSLISPKPDPAKVQSARAQGLNQEKTLFSQHKINLTSRDFQTI